MEPYIWQLLQLRKTQYFFAAKSSCSASVSLMAITLSLKNSGKICGSTITCLLLHPWEWLKTTL